MKLGLIGDVTYFKDLHPGDILPVGDGTFHVVTEDEINRDGTLKSNLTLATNIEYINTEKKEGEK